MDRKHIVLRTEKSKDAKEFIDFFRSLEGKKWQVSHVGLSGLTARDTKTVFLVVEEAEGEEEEDEEVSGVLRPRVRGEVRGG